MNVLFRKTILKQTMNNQVAPSTAKVQEAWKSEPPRRRRRSIIKEFALNTTVHGLPSIAQSHSKYNCMFWTVSFLIFAGAMTYFVMESIKVYFQYPTQTSVNIVVEPRQTFPAVTFCNKSPVRYDQAARTFLNYTNSTNTALINDSSLMTYNQFLMFYNTMGEMFNAGIMMSEIFFSIDMMLINCYYNGQTCTKDDFISFYSSLHGFCYTFNAQSKLANATAVREINEAGGPGRLILRFYTYSHSYVPYLSEGLSPMSILKNLIFFYFINY